MMALCTPLDLDYAEVCPLPAAAWAGEAENGRETFCVCADVFLACGDECARHQHDHCKDCAVACRRSAKEWPRMAAMS